VSAAHTPGPWTVTEYGIRSRAGYICQIIRPGRYPDQSERYQRESAERTADASVMAAGPNLLAALRELHRVCVGMDHPNQMQRPEEEEYLAAVAGAAAALQLVDGQ